jgi:hypothetical protein
MGKIFLYEVSGNEFSDTTPWGEGWQKAKAKATELHTYIERIVIEHDDNIRHEVFVNGYIFLNADRVKPEDYKIF